MCCAPSLPLCMWSPPNSAWGCEPLVAPLTSYQECSLLSTLLVRRGELGSKLTEKALFWQLIPPEWEEYWWFSFSSHTHIHTHGERDGLSSGVTICKVIAVSMRGSKTGDGQHKTLLFDFFLSQTFVTLFISLKNNWNIFQECKNILEGENYGLFPIMNHWKHFRNRLAVLSIILLFFELNAFPGIV